MIKVVLILILFSTSVVVRANEPLIISADLAEANHNLAAGAVCNVVNNSNFNTPCFTLPAKGETENISRLSRGQAQLAVMPANHYFYEKQRRPKLQPVMGLYSEALLIITREGSGIHTFADLKDHTVNLGKEKTPVWSVTRKVLESAGMDLTDLSSVTLLDPLDSVTKEAFCYGEIDALFILDSTPSKQVREIISACPVHLLNLSDAFLATVSQAHPYLMSTTIPENTYYNVPETTTLAQNTLLVAYEDSFNNTQGYRLAKLLTEKIKSMRGYSRIFDSSDMSVFTSPARCCSLQPGAERFFNTLKK